MSEKLGRLGIVAVSAASLLLGACSSGSDGASEASATPEPTVASSTVTGPDVTWSRSMDAALGGDGAQQGMVDVVAAGPGLVALGHEGQDPDTGLVGGVVWTSPDGSAWTRVHTIAAPEAGECGVFPFWTSAVAGGPGLVAVGGGWGWWRDECDQATVVWTSRDGGSWQQHRVEPVAWLEQMVDVTAGGPGLVAVGVRRADTEDSSAAVWTSPDGVTWTPVPDDEAVFGGKGSQIMMSVTRGGPGLVAVGGDRDSSAAVWTSPDGLTWTRVPDDEAVFGGQGNQHMSGVTIGGPGLVAVGEDWADTETGGGRAAVWTSPDGVTWTRVADDEAVFSVAGRNTSMGQVATLGSTLVATGIALDPTSNGAHEPLAWSSTDGVTWSVMDLGPLFDTGEIGYLDSLTVGGPGLVAVGRVEEATPHDEWAPADALVLTAVPAGQ